MRALLLALLVLANLVAGCMEPARLGPPAPLPAPAPPPARYLYACHGEAQVAPQPCAFQPFVSLNTTVPHGVAFSPLDPMQGAAVLQTIEQPPRLGEHGVESPWTSSAWLLTTSDGGVTWQRQQLRPTVLGPLAASLAATGVAFAPDGTLHVVGIASDFPVAALDLASSERRVVHLWRAAAQEPWQVQDWPVADAMETGPSIGFLRNESVLMWVDYRYRAWWTQGGAPERVPTGACQSVSEMVPWRGGLLAACGSSGARLLWLSPAGEWQEQGRIRVPDPYSEYLWPALAAGPDGGAAVGGGGPSGAWVAWMSPEGSWTEPHVLRHHTLRGDASSRCASLEGLAFDPAGRLHAAASFCEPDRNGTIQGVLRYLSLHVVLEGQAHVHEMPIHLYAEETRNEAPQDFHWSFVTGTPRPSMAFGAAGASVFFSDYSGRGMRFVVEPV